MIYPISSASSKLSQLAACRVSRTFFFLIFFFFFYNKISTPTPDNPLVNNEPLNPSGGVVMTIIGDFHRQE